MGDFELMLRKKIHAVFQAREDKFILMLKMETTLYELTWELEIVKELTMQKRLIKFFVLFFKGINHEPSFSY